ncbi:hypothetical protein PGTUg99_005613 [Puccinia graminis f. sp. tritici]|uniref:DUF7719 domain-containing protein n=1 Tax=Puccinia graminis f. sp. tritici TaxID=56615 RepID=A0A5B0S4K2_PUCGR|nr:hypothetical protein PGTUg99_005613 [Puccinia graminis f. sp. tritici]
MTTRKAGRGTSERSRVQPTRPATEEEKEDSGGGSDGPSPIELSAEAQMQIIEQTGILARIPRRRPEEPQRRAPKPAPLVQFSTLELDSFAKSLKTPTINNPHPSHEHEEELQDDEDDQETVRNLSRDRPSINNQQDSLPLWVDRAFDTFLWSIPFMTVFVCLDVAIHAQYGQPVTIRSELGRMANVYPSALFLIHYSLHYHEQVLANLLLFGLSTIGGSYMVYIMNRLSYLLVMRRVPPLGALWIYAVVRMHLSHAVLSLILVALWAWIMNLSFYV